MIWLQTLPACFTSVILKRMLPRKPYYLICLLSQHLFSFLTLLFSLFSMPLSNVTIYISWLLFINKKSFVNLWKNYLLYFSILYLRCFFVSLNFCDLVIVRKSLKYLPCSKILFAMCIEKLTLQIELCFAKIVNVLLILFPSTRLV